jgi:hypothetical protein
MWWDLSWPVRAFVVVGVVVTVITKLMALGAGMV